MRADDTTRINLYPQVLLEPGTNTGFEVMGVSYDKAQGVLVVNWEGEITSEKIRTGYDEVMKQVHLQKPHKILLDFHNRVAIRRRDQRWVFGSVFPEILRTIGDNVFVAIVLPVTLYYGLVAEMNGDELMQGNNFLIIHHCLYREEAYRWLETMHTSNSEGQSCA